MKTLQTKRLNTRMIQHALQHADLDRLKRLLKRRVTFLRNPFRMHPADVFVSATVIVERATK